MESPNRPPSKAAPELTLGEALLIATDYWSGRPGAEVMISRATRCVDLLGPIVQLQYVGRQLALKLIKRLNLTGTLQPRSVQDYYSTFRTMVAMCGHDLSAWPKVALPKGLARERLSLEELKRVAEWLDERGWGATADLVRLIAGTGLRCTVEVLPVGMLSVERGEDYDTLTVSARGVREIPVVDAHARAILRSPERLEAVHKHSYTGHLQRLRKGLRGAGLGLSRVSFRDIRFAFAIETFEKSGGNVELTAELLGSAAKDTIMRMVVGGRRRDDWQDG